MSSNSYDRNIDDNMHCSLGGRAWTNTTTNTTFIPEIDLSRDFEALYSLKGLPSSCLASFLHEAVHHWCFMSPVGTVLALLRVRAQLYSFEWMMEDDDDVGDAIGQSIGDDIAVYRMITALLRPMAEGLATFAEFDVLPLASTSVISKPMSWLYFAFCVPKEAELKGNYGLGLVDLLIRTRLTEDFIRRKANLLLNPAKVEHGGYLLGYLLVKRMWHHAMSRSKHFADADFFYMFLKRYIYNDYGLAGLLLTRVPGRNIVDVIMNYFSRRLHSFFDLDFEAEAIRAVETTLLIEKTETPTMMLDYPPINIDTEFHELGKKLVRDAVNRIQNGSFENVPYQLQLLCIRALAGRNILWLGDLDITLEVLPSGRLAVIYDKRTLFEVQPEFEAQPEQELDFRNTPASLELYFSLFDDFIMSTISVDSKVILMDFKGDSPRSLAILEQIKDYIVNRRQIDQFQDTFAGITENVSQQIGFEDYYKSHEQDTFDRVNSIYTNVLEGHVAERKREDCLALLQQSGIINHIGNDVTLLKSLALLSLLSSTSFEMHEVKKIVTDNGMELEELLKKLSAYTDRYGYPFMVRNDSESLLSLV